MKISVIAAIGSNRELGRDNKLLWHIGEDLKRFKKLTQGRVVIMGRKTYESIGKPLPNRQNIIITRDKKFNAQNCIIVNSIKDAIKIGNRVSPGEIFFIGGGEVYHQALPYAQKLYLTIVEGRYKADTYFPPYPAFIHKIFEQSGESEGYKYKWIELEK